MGRRRRPLLVYDAHEFEVGREIKRSRLQTFLVCRWERFLLNRCEFSIMVNNAISDEVMRIQKQTKRPVVARNIPYNYKLSSEVIAEKRAELLSMTSVDPAQAFIVMYHGLVGERRNLDNLADIVSRVDNAVLVIVGDGQPQYIESLQENINRLGIADRAILHPAVDWRILWQYVGAADVGTIIVHAEQKSYYLSLPNKFFENIRECTIANAYHLVLHEKLGDSAPLTECIGFPPMLVFSIQHMASP